MTGLQLTRRQYYALCTMVLLSPLLHLVPRKTTAEAGCCGWLCALAALVPLLLFAWMLEGILHRGRPGEGIGEITLRAHSARSRGACCWASTRCGFCSTARLRCASGQSGSSRQCSR